jgi:hypothetical protein
MVTVRIVLLYVSLELCAVLLFARYLSLAWLRANVHQVKEEDHCEHVRPLHGFLASSAVGIEAPVGIANNKWESTGETFRVL